MSISGIYWLYQPSRDRCLYVGSSADVYKRIRYHVNCLNGKRHKNIVLTRLWAKYDRADLVFSLLEECPVEQLLEREDYWTDVMPVWPKANLRIGATRPEHSEASIQKMKDSKRVVSAETRKKLSDAAKRRVATDETRQKMSAGMKGVKKSEETRRRMSQANTRRVFTQETREKIGYASRNRSPETRKKMSDSAKVRCLLERAIRAVTNYQAAASGRGHERATRALELLDKVNEP